MRLYRQTRPQYRADGRAYARSRSRVTKVRYGALVHFSKRRGYSMNIGVDQWAALLAQDCRYCGGPLSPTGHALDRKDSALGYELTNVVPCCGRCNRVKGDSVSYESMLAIGAILRKQDGR